MRSSDAYTPDFEALLDTVSGIVWEGEPETLRFRFVSRQAERLLGYPVERWLKEPDFFLAHVHEDDRPWVAELCRKETAAGRPHELEYRMIAADGRTVWLRDLVSVVFENGQIVACRGVMVDVTAQHVAEEAHGVASERMRRLVAHAPIVLAAIDRNGVVTFCEGRALQALDAEPSQIVGTSIADQRPEVQEVLSRAMAGEEFSTVVEVGGRTFEASYAPVRDPDGNQDGFIGVSTDVTERVRAEQERTQFEAQVRHTQKLESLGVLAGGIAHDFNNLLMNVLGTADLLLADLPASSPATAHAARIRRAARSAADLTNELLAYAGDTQRDVQSVDLSELVSEMTELTGVAISKKAAFETELAPDLPGIRADPAQLRQVVLNLITNASESLGEAPGVIRVRTGRIEVDRDYLATTTWREGVEEGPFVFVEVSDTGVGMDAETRARIFDPFFTTKFTGRGLGLASVQGIVRGHRGVLSVYSEPGRGSVFRVLLPAPVLAAEIAANEPEPARSWRGTGTALVVDDEDDVREISQVMLERLGFDVVAVADARAAERALAAEPRRYSLVLLDMTMPEMGGEEALGVLRSVREDVPIVLISGYTERYALERVAEQEISGFLQKPFGPDELASVLDGIFDAPE